MRDDKTISASEINRYIFCSYQWYYERKYGAAELRRRKKEHLEELGLTAQSENSHLKQGLVFHARFQRRRRLRLAYKWLRAAVIIGIFIYLLMRFGMVAL